MLQKHFLDIYIYIIYYALSRLQELNVYYKMVFLNIYICVYKVDPLLQIWSHLEIL